MDTKNYNKVNWKIVLRQLLISSTSSIFAIMGGMAMGAPTVIIPQLRREANSTDFISEELVSWTSSASNLSAVPWSIFLIAMSFYIGRKKTILFVNISTFIAFLNLYFSLDLTRVIIGQIILGIADGSMGTVCISIVTEYSSPKYRGIFLTHKEASYFWGIWISNALGTYFHWTTIGLIGMIIASFNLIVTLFIPESPYWLASKEKYEQCTDAYHWTRGTDDDTEKELDELISCKKSNKSQKRSREPFFRYVYKHIKVVLQPEMYRPLFCCYLLGSLYINSGKQACAVYAIDIIKKITNSEKMAYNGMLILDGFTVFGMYLASYLNKVMKRKTLLTSATVVCIIFMFTLSIYLYLVRFSVISGNNYVSMFLLIGYSLSACCGPMMMCVVIFSEILPVKYRSVGFIYCGVFCKSLLAIFLKLMPTILKLCGDQGIFLFFGVHCCLYMFLVYKYVPETKGKTLYEIAEYFKPSKTTELLEIKGDTTETTEIQS